MSMNAPEAGALSGLSHNLGHPLGTEVAMRRLDPHEYRPSLGALGTAVVQIRSHRSANVCRQRQALGRLSFTAHNDLAGTPVDIVEPKRGDFASSHAETDRHGQDGDVAATIQSAAIA